MVTRLLQARNTETRNHALQTKSYHSRISPFFWSLCNLCASIRIKAILSWPFQDHVVHTQDFTSTPEWKTWSWNKFLHTNWCHTAPLHRGKCARKHSLIVLDIRRSGRSKCSFIVQVRSPRTSPRSHRWTLGVRYGSRGVRVRVST